MKMDVCIIATLILIRFQVKSHCFLTTDCIGQTLNQPDIVPDTENFIFQSLWAICNKQNRFSLKTSKLSYVCLLILLCGDIETCPGPLNLPELQSLLNSKGMKFFHQNVRGLLGNRDLVMELLQSFPKIDILSRSETHLTSEPNELFTILGYTFISRNRNSGKGGVVGVYISDRVSWVRRHDLESDELEMLWIEVLPGKAKIVLLSVLYRPPDTSKSLQNNFNKLFNDMLSIANTESKEVILMGDVNVNYLIARNNKEFKSVLELFGFKQLITKPTRNTNESNTLINIIASNNSSTISKTDVISTSIGDHDMVGCCRKINLLKFNPRVITCRNYKNYASEKLCSDLNSVDWSPVYDALDVNSAWTYMKSILLDAFNKHGLLIK